MKAQKIPGYVSLALIVVVLAACGQPALQQPLPKGTAIMMQSTATTSETPTNVPIPTITASQEWYQHYIGINIAGAEFGKEKEMPGNIGKDYIYPGADNCDDINKWIAVTDVIRYPIRYERIKRDLSAGQGNDLTKLKNALSCIKKDTIFIIDLHNYGHVWENGIERPLEPAEVADFWRGMARALNAFPNVVFDLMNEPHDIGDKWPQIAQESIKAIRETDSSQWILVEGENWSGAWDWTKTNQNLYTLQDPRNRLIFEAHQYFDPPQYSGTYECIQTGNCTISPNLIMDTLDPFLHWCTNNRVRCFIGEIGVPTTNTNWQKVLQDALAYLHTHEVGATIWAAGPWWGDYLMSAEQPGGEWVSKLLKNINQ